MSGFAGLFGVVGFIAYEISSYLSLGVARRKLYGRMFGTVTYFVIVCVFALLTGIVAMLFASPNMNAAVWPLEWSPITIVEGARAFLVGVATVHIYKISGKQSAGSAGQIRVETTNVELDELEWRTILRWWRSV